MSNEIKLVWTSGKTLTFVAYEPDGTARGVAQALPEIGATGFYTVTPTTELVTGDVVRVYDDTGEFVGGAEYRPEADVPTILDIDERT